MDEKRTDLRAAMRELAAEESESVGSHVGLKRLIAYREGTLPAAEREALQEHLSLCARCTRLLRELRDFEAASASGDTGPESLRQEAWEFLVRHLPANKPAVRPIAGAPREVPRLGRFRYAVYGVAAAFLLSVLGLSVWAAVTIQQERRRLAHLEQQLAEREEALASARRSLANAERQLAAARGHIQDLEKGKVDRSRRQDATPAGGGQLRNRVDELANGPMGVSGERPIVVTGESPLTGSREIWAAVAPRFALRDQPKAEGGFLRGEGAVNSVRIPTQADGFTVALSLADHPIYAEYRFELMARDGKVLWTAQQAGKSLLGDSGTSVSFVGLAPGVYRLRIDGLQAGRRELLAEYVLAVERQGILQ